MYDRLQSHDVSVFFAMPLAKALTFANHGPRNCSASLACTFEINYKWCDVIAHLFLGMETRELAWYIRVAKADLALQLGSNGKQYY